MIKALSSRIKQGVSGEKLVFLNFSGSTLLRTLVLAVSGMLVMAWVTPAEIGLYNSYSVLVGYVFLLQLGVFNGLNRQVPYLLGKGDTEAIDMLVKSSLALAKWLSLSSIVIGFASLGASGFMGFQLSDSARKMAMAIIFLTAMNFYQNYLTVTYRTSRHFDKLAKINFFSCILIALSSSLVYFFRYDGLIMFYLVNNASYLLLTHWFRPYRVGAAFSLSALKGLVSIGMPIFIFSYIQQVSKSLNRVILVYVASTVMVGLFSPATAAFSAIAFLPGTISQFAYPKFSHLYGKTNDSAVFVPYVKKIYLSTLMLLVPVVFLVWLLFPVMFKFFLPDYVAGIHAAQLLVLSGVIDITTIAVNIFYSVGIKRAVAIYTIFRFMIMLVAPLICLLFCEPLIAVSLGTLLATILSAMLSYFLLIKNLK